MMTATTKTPVKTTASHCYQPNDFSNTCSDLDGGGLVDGKDLILLITSFYDPYGMPSERVLFAVSEQPTTQMPVASSQQPAASTHVAARFARKG
jgi:hypothetical protein